MSGARVGTAEEPSPMPCLAADAAGGRRGQQGQRAEDSSDAVNDCTRQSATVEEPSPKPYAGRGAAFSVYSFLKAAVKESTP